MSRVEWKTGVLELYAYALNQLKRIMRVERYLYARRVCHKTEKRSRERERRGHAHTYIQSVHRTMQHSGVQKQKNKKH
jgi:hypothetical protein